MRIEKEGLCYTSKEHGAKSQISTLFGKRRRSSK